MSALERWRERCATFESNFFSTDQGVLAEIDAARSSGRPWQIALRLVRCAHEADRLAATDQSRLIAASSYRAAALWLLEEVARG